jgi:hypothetical protein
LQSIFFDWKPLLEIFFAKCILIDVRKADTSKGKFKKQLLECIVEVNLHHTENAAGKENIAPLLLQLNFMIVMTKASKCSSGIGWNDALG